MVILSLYLYIKVIIDIEVQASENKWGIQFN